MDNSAFIDAKKWSNTSNDAIREKITPGWPILFGFKILTVSKSSLKLPKRHQNKTDITAHFPPLMDWQLPSQLTVHGLAIAKLPKWTGNCQAKLAKWTGSCQAELAKWTGNCQAKPEINFHTKSPADNQWTTLVRKLTALGGEKQVFLERWRLLGFSLHDAVAVSETHLAGLFVGESAFLDNHLHRGKAALETINRKEQKMRMVVVEIIMTVVLMMCIRMVTMVMVMMMRWGRWGWRC